MADVIVSGLVSDVLMSLGSAAFKEFSRLQNMKDDVSALEDTYILIQAVVSDAEVKQREQKSVEEWLNRLRSASLEMENILDDVLAEAKLQMLENELEKGYQIQGKSVLSSNHNPLIVRVRVDIANKVKTILKKLDMIAKDKSQFNFIISNILSVDVGVGNEIRETTSLVPLFKIYGRDKEVKTVVDKICSKDENERFRIYAIWGMGGVGKTTLAQLVYNHEQVKAHFELQSWVYVSNEFQVKKVTRGIIESINTKSPCQLSHLDAMQVDLLNKLQGKRFFIVLDDVWFEDRDMKKWEELSKALSSGANGSIIMVTTRNQTTSRMMAKVSEFQHQVGCLSEEDSWSLFKKLAFASGSSGRELEFIGKEIVHKCQGLPLAVRTLGGLMWSKISVNEWQSVKDSDVWNLPGNDILPALKLSYDNLLPHMKRCFAYCCLFPKGFYMGKYILIDLWMANGFIPPRGETDLYVIGEETFNCLVSRSFLQELGDTRHYRDGLVCKMHDLMHDLAQNVMKQDFYLIVPGKSMLITPGRGRFFISVQHVWSFPS